MNTQVQGNIGPPCQAKNTIKAHTDTSLPNLQTPTPVESQAQGQEDRGGNQKNLDLRDQPQQTDHQGCQASMERTPTLTRDHHTVLVSPFRHLGSHIDHTDQQTIRLMGQIKSTCMVNQESDLGFMINLMII